jgi:hypothetical protein
VNRAPCNPNSLTDRKVETALALLDLDPAPSADEIEAVADRLRLWAAAPAPPGGNANWASLKDAAQAVIEGLARIDEGTDDDAGVDALNEVAVRPRGPVAGLLLDAVAGLLGSVPHSAGTFSEGSAAVLPTEAERELSFAYFYEPEAASAASRQEVKTTMLSFTDMSSCHFSAQQLEGLLGQPQVQEAQVGQTRKAGRDEDLGPPAAALDRAVRELAASIRASAEGGDERVFNIMYASHSFTVVTTRDRVEVLQSFAGGGGYPLGTGITRGQQFAPADFEPLLIAALVPNEIPAVSADSQSQRALFGGSVFDEEFMWPLVTLRTRLRALRPREEITERATARATSNLEVYRGATAPSRSEKVQTEKKEKRKKELLAVKSGRVEKKSKKTREKKQKEKKKEKEKKKRKTHF